MGTTLSKLKTLRPFGLSVDLSEEQMKISEAYNAPMSSRHALQSLQESAGQCLKLIASKTGLETLQT
jgi:hypothetical protein